MLTNQPIRGILSRVDFSSQLMKWSAELSEYGIEFDSWKAMKEQAFADFVAECTFMRSTEGMPSFTLPTPNLGTTDQPLLDVTVEPIQPGEQWILFVDGSATKDGANAGLHLTSIDGQEFQYGLAFRFPLSNNATEYEALIAGLNLAVKMGAKDLRVNTDSQLVAKQVLGKYKVKEPNLANYNQTIQKLWTQFNRITLQQIPSEENVKVDSLSKLLSASSTIWGKIILEYVERPSSQPTIEVLDIEDEPSWKTPIIQFLEGKIPESRMEVTTLQRRAARYTLINGVLYKRSHALPLLRCVGPKELEYILREIHEGACGNHEGDRTLAQKTIRQGFY